MNSMWSRMNPNAFQDALSRTGVAQQPTTQPTSYQPSPAVNPNSLINPYYMQAQPMDYLAPMSMYQNYKATGQMPAQTNSFQASPATQLQGSK